MRFLKHDVITLALEMVYYYYYNILHYLLTADYFLI